MTARLSSSDRRLGARLPTGPADTTAREALGRAIDAWLTAQGWTQTDLCARIGRASATVSNWIRGVTSPSEQALKQLVALGFEPPAQGAA